MKRCEMIITEYCNFKCPYCRGLKDEIYGNIKGEKLWIRKKPGTYAVMFFNENKGEHFWTHLSKKEFEYCFSK
jgi:hypothetical protein